MKKYLRRFINKIKLLVYTIATKYLQWRGYLGKDYEPLKCPFCHCKKIETYERFIHDQGFVEEYWVRCSNCKERLGVWAYGSWYN